MSCQLDLCASANTLLAVVAAAVGWWIVHRLNSARDRVNAERLARTTELAKAHAALVRAGIDGVLIRKDEKGNIVSTSQEVENAIGVIYLYGTPQQAALARQYVQSFAKNQAADATELVSSLRSHIRASLGLPHLVEPVDYLRIQKPPRANQPGE